MKFSEDHKLSDDFMGITSSLIHLMLEAKFEDDT